MELAKHERFIAANRDLRDFLQRAAGFANGNAPATEGDLMIILVRLLTLAPEVGDASRGEALDTELRDEIAEYVKNFRELQQVVDKIRCSMMGRRVHFETATRSLEGKLGWLSADHQATD